MHFLLCFSYMVHHLSVTPHRPLNGSHRHLHMFFYYSSVPIISFVVTLWFLRAEQGCRWWRGQFGYQTDTKTL